MSFYHCSTCSWAACYTCHKHLWWRTVDVEQLEQDQAKLGEGQSWGVLGACRLRTRGRGVGDVTPVL